MRPVASSLTRRIGELAEAESRRSPGKEDEWVGSRPAALAARVRSPVPADRDADLTTRLMGRGWFKRWRRSLGLTGKARLRGRDERRGHRPPAGPASSALQTSPRVPSGRAQSLPSREKTLLRGATSAHEPSSRLRAWCSPHPAWAPPVGAASVEGPGRGPCRVRRPLSWRLPLSASAVSNARGDACATHESFLLVLTDSVCDRRRR